MASDWQKGGVRYAKLKQVIPSYLAPSPVERFFVAVRSMGGTTRLVNPLTPLQPEYVVVATPDELVVVRLKRPGVFRAAVKGVECRAPIKDVALQMQDGRLLVGGNSYEPIAFHDEDARELCRYVQERHDNGWASEE